MRVRSRTPAWQRGLAGAATIVLCAAAYRTAQLSYADHLAAGGEPEKVARAVRLAPANARYWLRWADLLEQLGEPSGHAIDGAVAASPLDSEVWIRAGLAAESREDYVLAERCLLQAARVSRQYEPRWTLAGYYFRRGNAGEFWRWMRTALEWAHGDRRPLFQLAWEMNDVPRTVLDAIPENAPSLNAYLDFLVSSGRLEAAREAVGRLAPLARPEDRQSVLRYIALMIEARQPGPALAAWNQLCSRRLLPYQPADPGRGRLVTNGDFELAPMDAGFDWRIMQARGISAVRGENPPFLRLSFSGQQPENCQVLAQLVPVEPATDYALRFEYQSTAIPPKSGLCWKLFNADDFAELKARSPELSANQAWTAGEVTFTTPAATHWVWLMLAYDRAPGTTRIEGTIALRKIALARTR